MSNRRSPSYRVPTGWPPRAVLMSCMTSSLRTFCRAIRARSGTITSCGCGPSCSMLTSIAPRTLRSNCSAWRASLRSSSGSGPENSIARLADVPLVSSVTLSIIGWVKLNRVVGNSSRSRLPISATNSCLSWKRFQVLRDLGPTIISMRLGGKGSVPLSLRPDWIVTYLISGNSSRTSRTRLPKRAVCSMAVPSGKLARTQITPSSM